MIRYVKQNDVSSCGVVAVLNALKWAGSDMTWSKHKHKLRLICKWVSGRTRGDMVGCRPTDIDIALSSYKSYFHATMIVRPGIGVIDSNLKKDNSFILRYMYDDGGNYAHYVFCPEKKGNRYIIVNADGYKTIDMIGRNELKKLLKNKSTEGFNSIIWFLDIEGA